MKIIGIHGSPRREGSSAQLMGAILRQCEAGGAQTQTYHLNTLKISGCQACYSCRQEGKEGKCAIKDDMNRILEDILAADAVVLASPVYMWQMTAQAKLFTDRLMPVLKQDYTSRLNGQRLLTVYTQGQPDVTKFATYFQYVKAMYSFLGFRALEPFVAGGLRALDDLKNQPEIMEKARQAAAGLMVE
ncbi:MAG: flavodoxin family protein [Desulfocapsaceae bacterium]|nr:flavodoxin family protein [Desulfocapsaceae bacterium]